MSIILAILPIVLVILCGYGLVRRRAVTPEQWTGIEILSFRFLIPVVLIRAVATADLDLSRLGPMLGVTALGLAGGLVLCLRGVGLRQWLPDPDFTTLFQTTIRWNAFIALAAAELLAGPVALELIAAALAVLIPLINVAAISALVRYGTAKTTLWGIVSTILNNPIVRGCAIGLAINLAGKLWGLSLPEPAIAALDLIGRAALGVGLLAVGAAIVPARLLRRSPAVILGVCARLLLCPLLFLGLASGLGLDQLETLAGLLVCAVPAASNGYILARQMGGNAELYADILTWQTVLSLITLPVLTGLALA